MAGLRGNVNILLHVVNLRWFAIDYRMSRSGCFDRNGSGKCGLSFQRVIPRFYRNWLLRMFGFYLAIGAIMALGVAWDMSRRDSLSMQADAGTSTAAKSAVRVSNAR